MLIGIIGMDYSLKTKEVEPSQLVKTLDAEPRPRWHSNTVDYSQLPRNVMIKPENKEHKKLYIIDQKIYRQRLNVMNYALAEKWSERVFERVIKETGLTDDGVNMWTGAYMKRRGRRD